MLTEFHPALAADDLAEGEMRGVRIAGESILLARVAGQIYAINDICSHFHTHLSAGELDVDHCEVKCPLHDSCFDLRTGEPTDLPAEEPVQTYAVKLDGGRIWVGPG